MMSKYNFLFLTISMIYGSLNAQELIIDKEVYQKGELINVEFTKTDSTPDKAWIGIVPSYVPHGKESVNDENDIVYRFIVDHPNGEIQFRAPSIGYEWDIRYCSNDKPNKEYTFLTFTIDTLSNELSIEDELKVWNVPAVGIGIIENGKITETKVYGELTFGQPAPDNAIFNVASLTKPVIAIITLKLISNGDWSLEEPLSNYWVDPDIKDNPYLDKLTTLHVLSHQSGFPNWRRRNDLSFSFKPGSNYQYSGEGFEYLRKAIENKFNKPIEEIADSLLFQPLEMNETRFVWDTNVDEDRFVQWHDEGGYNYHVWKRKNANAADDLLTTIDDYSIFGLAVLNKIGLATEIFNEMKTPQVKRTENRSFGLGWEIVQELENNEIALYHGGSDRGVKTKIILLPDSKRGLIIFTNGDNGEYVIEKIVSKHWDFGKELWDKMNQ